MNTESQVLTEEKKGFIEQYKIPITLAAGGLILVLLGIRLLMTNSQPQVEFVEEASSTDTKGTEIKVDVAGAVEKPGLYTLGSDSRIQDALAAAGGLSAEADRKWLSSQLNLATKVSDGMKIYIPTSAETGSSATQVGKTLGVVTSNTSKGIISINTATEVELDTLPGVGKGTVQKIIANRPYQSVEELLTKKAVNKSTFEKIKDRVSAF